nr:MAG TPA: hypothetical protein [Caudoviricetes sp.]
MRTKVCERAGKRARKERNEAGMRQTRRRAGLIAAN